MKKEKVKSSINTRFNSSQKHTNGLYLGITEMHMHRTWIGYWMEKLIAGKSCGGEITWTLWNSILLFLDLFFLWHTLNILFFLSMYNTRNSFNSKMLSTKKMKTCVLICIYAHSFQLIWMRIKLSSSRILHTLWTQCVNTQTFEDTRGEKFSHCDWLHIMLAWVSAESPLQSTYITSSKLELLWNLPHYNPPSNPELYIYNNFFHEYLLFKIHYVEWISGKHFPI